MIEVILLPATKTLLRQKKNWYGRQQENWMKCVRMREDGR
jgi:hypothetical protein